MVTKVAIIESERGWGQKIDEVIEFDTHAQAEEYCKEYNDKYNPDLGGRVPDWYMVATILE